MKDVEPYNTAALKVTMAKARDLIASLSPKIALAQSIMERHAEMWRDAISRIIPPPRTLLGDLLRVAKGADDEVRLAAARRLAHRKWFERPIYSARWPFVEPAVRARATNEDASVEFVFRRAVESALFLAVGEGWKTHDAVRVGSIVKHGPIRPVNLGFDDYFRWLRARVANEICGDFLGPGWRRTDSIPLEDLDDHLVAGQMASQAEAELRLMADEALHRKLQQVGLSEREMQTLLLASEGRGGSEIAAALGVKPSTARVHLRNARRKVNIP